MKLHRYWITFEDTPAFSILRLGCGVTAFDRQDAVGLLEASVFRKQGRATIREIVEDVKVADFDQNHVVPNMESPSIRGVWFPSGYALP